MHILCITESAHYYLVIAIQRYLQIHPAKTRSVSRPQLGRHVQLLYRGWRQHEDRWARPDPTIPSPLQQVCHGTGQESRRTGTTKDRQACVNRLPQAHTVNVSTRLGGRMWQCLSQWCPLPICESQERPNYGCKRTISCSSYRLGTLRLLRISSYIRG